MKLLPDNKVKSRFIVFALWFIADVEIVLGMTMTTLLGITFTLEQFEIVFFSGIIVALMFARSYRKYRDAVEEAEKE